VSPAAPVRVRLSLLLTEAATELEALDRVAAELAVDASELDAPEVGRPVLAVVAVDLHDYFTAAETLFERIASSAPSRYPPWSIEAPSGGGFRSDTTVGES